MMSSLRHKLWLGFGGLMLILLIVSLISVLVLTIYSRALQNLFSENYNSAVYCEGLQDALDKLNLAAQQLTWDQPPPSPPDIDGPIAAFESNLAKQLDNCTLPHERQRTESLARGWTQYVADYHQFVTAAPARRIAIYRTDLLSQNQSLKQAAQQIADMNTLNMVSVDGQVRGALVSLRNALLVLCGAGVAAAVVVVGAASTSILRPLGALTESARQIEQGNLDLSLRVQSHDEIGRLAEAFNSMAARLREFRQLDHHRLVRTQQTTQLAIDSLPDAVFIIGHGDEVEISNRTARTYFGIEPGLTITQLAPKLPWVLPLFESVKQGQKPPDPQGYRSAIQLFENGHERFLLPRAVAILSPDGQPIGVIVTLVDVTRLRSADEAKSSIVSTVSHELRTPLTSIRMALGLVLGGKFGDVPPTQAKLLQAAREDSDRLHRTLDNLLNMSRIESGRAQFQPRPVTPIELVRQAAEPLRPALEEKGLTLEIDVPADLPALAADPAAIAAALGNLLSNALKYTPAPGRVRITAHRAAGGQSIRFQVSDTGPGIPEEFRGRLFEKFFRVPRSSGPGGAGLGLSITREIVEAHGGIVEFVNGADRPGATFQITLPLIAAPA